MKPRPVSLLRTVQEGVEGWNPWQALAPRGVRVATRTGALVSLFALRRTARVTLTGTAWTLAKRIVRPGSLGLSNTARGPVRLTVHAGVAALVFPSLLR